MIEGAASPIGGFGRSCPISPNVNLLSVFIVGWPLLSRNNLHADKRAPPKVEWSVQAAASPSPMGLQIAANVVVTPPTGRS